MKNTKAIYWIIAILFAAFMILSAVPDILSTPEAVAFMNHLGYPNYFIPFIGVAKLLGIIAILVPGFPRIREWAYGGLCFDLVGATYSVVSVDGLKPQMAIMVLPLGFLFISYFLYRKLENAKKLVGVAGFAMA
jgi:hypothetical protein